MSEYFYVVAEDEKGNEEVLYRDLSKKELKKLFLKPFKKGANFLIEGTIHKNEEIKKVQIINTVDTFDRSLEVYEDQQNESRTKLNNEQHGGIVLIGPHFSQDKDILECGESVTSEFIKRPPSKHPRFVTGILKNPWFIRIVGGIILALILWAISHYSGLAL